MTDLEKIRENERISHITAYTENELYESGSWLQKPIKTVMDIVSLFEDYQELSILDLGSGVGRNCIPFAQAYRDISCKIECIDILELAIEKLMHNAKKYGVEGCIKGYVTPIEEYHFIENNYDLIMSVSALEHIDSEDSFIQKLEEISRGIRKNGFVCLVMNSSVTEKNKMTGEALTPQFEVNITTDTLSKYLKATFDGWDVIKMRVQEQHYDIPRGNLTSELTSNVITFVARKQ